MAQKSGISIDELAVFCKRKGFVYPSAEVYGGLSGFWDYGSLGVEMVRNLKNAWWDFHVRQRDDVVGVDGSIITNPKVWEASGHVSNFVDVYVVCKKCGSKNKVDKHELKTAKCPKCGGSYEAKGEFNPMFTTSVGPVKSEAVTAYLRPETAQSIFANFKLVFENARLKLPCGIAQIGKAFRNEIAPREFLFRAREFEQMELEYFIKRGMPCPYMNDIKKVTIQVLTAEMQEKGSESKEMGLHDAWKKGIIATDWHAYWIAQELSWFVSLGADSSHFRARQHTKDEKSHYALDTWDIEYLFPMGWRELEGLANRGDYDLKQHQGASKTSFEVLDDSGKKFIPDVVCEPSLGVGRAFIVLMLEAYNHDTKRDNVVLKLHPKIAPYSVAVLPLISKGEVLESALELSKNLRKEFSVFFDKSGSIGRRYSRNDEVGTPYCVTVDNDSVSKGIVTIRDRDSTEQISVKASDVSAVLRGLVNGAVFAKAGKTVKTRVK